VTTIDTGIATDVTPAGGLDAPAPMGERVYVPDVFVTPDGCTVVTGDRERELLCVCGAQKAYHRGRTHQGGYPPHGCKRMRLIPESRLLLRAARTVDRSLSADLRQADEGRQRTRSREYQRLAVQTGERTFSVGPSDASSCRKAIQYRERPPADYTPVPTDKRAALMGTLIHEGVRRIRKRRYPWRQYEVVCHVPGLDRPGKCDEYDELLGIVFDLKTAGDWKWDLIAESGPPLSEWEQVMLYALALIRAGKYVREVRIVYVQRANGRDEVFIRPYDEKIALAALNRLTAVLDGLHAGIDLPRDEPGPTLSAICRTYCPARDHCWGVTEAEKAGRSPESWTLIHDDADVEWALSVYDEHRAIESAAKKEKAKAKALLEGVELGHYGPFFYGESGGRLLDPVPDYAARAEQLERLYALPDDRRPALVDLPMPTVQKRSSVSIAVKKQRAAATEREQRLADAAGGLNREQRAEVNRLLGRPDNAVLSRADVARAHEMVQAQIDEVQAGTDA
jgi:hypothetical protein